MFIILQLLLLAILSILLILNIIQLFKRSEHLEGDYGWQGQIRYKPFTSVAKNIRLNKFNRAENISMRQPLPRRGESNCVRADCPTYFDRDTLCWKCF
jgi:competence protein ComGC